MTLDKFHPQNRHLRVKSVVKNRSPRIRTKASPSTARVSCGMYICWAYWTDVWTSMQQTVYPAASCDPEATGMVASAWIPGYTSFWVTWSHSGIVHLRRVQDYQHDRITDEQHPTEHLDKVYLQKAKHDTPPLLDQGSNLQTLRILSHGPVSLLHRKDNHINNIPFSPRNFRNSFIVHKPHDLACSMPIISTSRKAGGVPRARNAPAGFSIAAFKILANSSSENFPSTPRWRLSYM